MKKMTTKSSKVHVLCWFILVARMHVSAFPVIGTRKYTGQKCISSLIAFTGATLQLQCQSSVSLSYWSSPGNSKLPKAILQGYVSPSDLPNIIQALERTGFDTGLIKSNHDDTGTKNEMNEVDHSHSSLPTFEYRFVRATGMLKLTKSPPPSRGTANDSSNNKHYNSNHIMEQAPVWIPIVSDMEHVLVENGWSFLDPDESEPLSAFDVNAANVEGLYQPKWGRQQPGQSLPGQQGSNDGTASVDGNNFPKRSALGYNLEPWTTDQIVDQANQLSEAQSRRVLLEGATDIPRSKKTHNGYDLSGSIKDFVDTDDGGTFVCAIGGLPLFATRDLSPLTASSGWLSFSRPLSEDHIVLVQPLPEAIDQRVEVLCARTRCHIGHYFGQGEGYCINASALNYVPVPKHQLLIETDNTAVPMETILLGAGCFWHVEHALRRLRGVVSTQVGYAGGPAASHDVTYEEVCQGQSGHAEVVQVRFDPRLLPPNILLDCFLAMHDPTKIRAHGKHAKGTGQYRSCIFVETLEMQVYGKQSLVACRAQLGKDLSTELNMVPSVHPRDKSSKGTSWFHVAEEKHQRHKEKRKLQSSPNPPSDFFSGLPTQLEPVLWLSKYGKRSKSTIGSAQTIQ